MRFNAFKIDAAQVAAMLAGMQTSFAASGKPGTFAENAARVIGTRLRNHPEQYLEFGPYWWAVKAALAQAGYEFGDAGDPVVAAEYTFPTAVECLVAGEAFKDLYRANYFRGNAEFDLVGDGEVYRLEDPDMQQRIALA